ncbi:MAG: serine/threonine-protein kinase [Acidobacteriota bacterium]
MSTPAEQLGGQTLTNGWTVGKLIVKTGDQTGGHFSCSYEVTNQDGRVAFLKAMDYARALAAPDPATALNELTSAFLFEREVLQECIEKKMSRVVRAIDGGKIAIGGQVVEYLIFEKARGDIRSYLDGAMEFDLVWTVTCIHNICVGIKQLNGANIAHQDLKPSNVLEFASEGQKLADLGRAWHRSRVSPHDLLACAGDRGYAPPELLYRYSDPNESDRRFGADFYLTGSMVLFLFTGMRASSMLLAELSPQHHPRRWKGTYHEVLPYLQHAFSINLATIKAAFPDSALGAEIVDVVQQMCDPNIATRGDRFHKAAHGSRFGMQRIVSRFDRLRSAAILGKVRHS